MKHLFKPLLTALLLLCSIVVNAYDFKVDGIYYNILSEEDKTVEVTYQSDGGPYGPETYVKEGMTIIPETVNYNNSAYKVIKIGKDAFRRAKNLTSITIPQSIISIETGAFFDCPLEKVINYSDLVFTKGSSDYGDIADGAKIVINIPQTQIENGFVFNTKLGRIHILEAYIGDETELILPKDYKGDSYLIGEYAFADCSNITDIQMPNSVTAIETGTFKGCSSLKSIIIPDKCTTIGELAFYKCSSLAKVTIGGSVTSIGNNAFNHCDNLKVLHIEDGNTPLSLGYSEALDQHGYPLPVHFGLFDSCPLDTLYLGRNLKYETERSEPCMHAPFSGHGERSVKHVIISNSVTRIEHCLFYNCKEFTSITIPNSVTSIGSNAFYICI